VAISSSPLIVLLHQLDHGEQFQTIYFIPFKTRFEVLLLLFWLEITQSRILAVANQLRLPKVCNDVSGNVL
jgi:hypothetical protein